MLYMSGRRVVEDDGIKGIRYQGTVPKPYEGTLIENYYHINNTKPTSLQDDIIKSIKKSFFLLDFKETFPFTKYGEFEQDSLYNDITTDEWSKILNIDHAKYNGYNKYGMQILFLVDDTCLYNTLEKHYNERYLRGLYTVLEYFKRTNNYCREEDWYITNNKCNCKTDWKLYYKGQQVAEYISGNLENINLSPKINDKVLEKIKKVYSDVELDKDDKYTEEEHNL